MYCPTCGKELEQAPVNGRILYIDTDGECDGILMGCTECNSLWEGKLEDIERLSINWICNYTVHLKLVALTKGFPVHIHTHPDMEEGLDVPEDHVIIDRSAYMDVLRRLASI